MKQLYLLVFTAVLSCTGPLSIDLEPVETPSKQLLIASHTLEPNDTWMTGTESEVLHLVGPHIEKVDCPYDSLQLRDVHAFSTDHVLALSIGPGSDSKVLRWQDGSWSIAYTLLEPDGFLDCMDFWDDRQGLIYGDSFDGLPYILITGDGGITWNRIQDGLPAAGEGEGGFASSGTCLQTGVNGTAWIGTGAGGNARLLVTADFGKTWRSMNTPMIKGEAAGITSLDFVDARHGIIVGGDLQITDEYTANIFITEDGGATWSAPKHPITLGAFYCVAYQEIQHTKVILVCGPNGADVSLDNGESWQNVSEKDLWRCELGSDGSGWLMGRDGILMRVRIS